MIHQIIVISEWTMRIMTFILFVLSLVFCFRSYNPAYMRSFPVYCLGNLLAEIVSKAYPPSQTICYVVFTVFELVYFSWFLLGLIRSGPVKKGVIFLNVLFLLYMTYKMVRNDMNFNISRSVIFESIILVIPCLAWFREIFTRPRIMNLVQEPSFWMVTGILFYFMLLLPTFFVSGYFYRLKMANVGDAVYSINTYSQFISYILFVKAMTCRRKMSY